MRHWFLVAAVAVACWDAWRWYLQRVWQSPEEAASLLAAIALTWLTGGAASQQPPVSSRYSLPGPIVPRPPAPGVPGTSPGMTPVGVGRAGARLVPLAVILACYAASVQFAPPILRAGVAVFALLYALRHAAVSRILSDTNAPATPPALWCMGLLALPVVPSLQFYLGYPMRLVSAAVSVVLLQLNGLSVDRQGTFLVWRSELVQFDAPCSGVSMLWAGLLLTAMIAYIHRLTWRGLLVAFLVSGGMLLAGNIVRATSLFYLETGIVWWAPSWWHEAVGLAAFGVSAIGIVWTTGKLKPCPA